MLSKHSETAAIVARSLSTITARPSIRSEHTERNFASQIEARQVVSGTISNQNGVIDTFVQIVNIDFRAKLTCCYPYGRVDSRIKGIRLAEHRQGNAVFFQTVFTAGQTLLDCV